ncbi:hypothetical protein PVAP13_3NG189300 [Panicum virgatum]|uniref:Knottin scorpion toxin-like domain-containing protein n=1 Tax=Panicum virgatum TaxID=38727 RepID=A0A8T0UFS8_PANVG|nr:hypothetical protein PVAP13_3NG189300 [Panicum virgatum]
MAPSQMNLSAVLLLVVLLLPVVMAAGESVSAGKFVDCHEHLSSNYKGICVGWIHDAKCKRTCLEESSDNYDGFCNFFQCWCQSTCTSETEAAAAASAPIRH